MRVRQSVGDLPPVIQYLVDGKPDTRRHDALERHAINELHGDERAPLVFADFMNRADVRMVERGRRPRLAHQPRFGDLIVDIGGGQHLIATSRCSFSS